MEIPHEVRAYYERGREAGRLSETPQGRLELLRTQDIVQRYLMEPPGVVLDVGGGSGVYSCWLASLGDEVHLIDPVPLHVQQAQEASSRQPTNPIKTCTIGDARQLAVDDDSVDAVLLFGPLYHLVQENERLRALSEAHRVLRPGGIVLAAGVSRFASALDGVRRQFVLDENYRRIMIQDMLDGQHQPTSEGKYFTIAFFHHPEELKQQLSAVGFEEVSVKAIEGPFWLLGDLDTYLDSSDTQSILFDVLRSLEDEPSLVGASSHMIAIGRKP